MRRICLVPMTCLSVFLILFSFAIWDTANSKTGHPALSIVRITPSGVDVPPGRQIVLQFDRAVVPVGRRTSRRGSR